MSFSHLQPTTAEACWRKAGVDKLREIDAELIHQLRGIIILAGHPDDETLGCAGLLKMAEEAHIPCHVTLFTAGENSHLHSPTHSIEQLTELRKKEFNNALRQLNTRATFDVLGLPDGGLSEHVAFIRHHITELVLAAPKPLLLVAPLHNDGHSDHDTLGLVARNVGKHLNVHVAEYPIWYWHWAKPQNSQWKSWQRLPDPPQFDRSALGDLYPSQTTALSGYAGDEAIVSTNFLEHFQRSYDTYAITPQTFDAHDAAKIFNQLHLEQPDPWKLAGSVYEEEKRQQLLDALSTGYQHALEIGCSIGTLTASLATRSDRVTALDASRQAITAARQHHSAHDNIEFICLTVPFQWPQGTYDLVVLSEIGYYLSEPQLLQTLHRIQASAAPSFTLALCHVKGEIQHWPSSAATVHQFCTHFWSQESSVTSIETTHYLIDVLRIHTTATSRTTSAAHRNAS